MRTLYVALTAVALVPAAAAEGAVPEGDAARGAKTFQTACALCHARTPSEPARMGPLLFRSIGARAATIDARYSYSPALKQSKLVWTQDAMDRWLAEPGLTVPGSRMFYPGLPDAKARADVIAYMGTLK